MNRTGNGSLRGLRGLIVKGIVLGRWAMVPLFAGLLFALLLLVVAFFMQLWKFTLALPTLGETGIIVNLLSLIDLALIGGLIVIVVSSGYENFVEKLDHDASENWPVWMTRISFSGLKLKLFATIMAIAAVALLKALIGLETNVSETQVRWLVIANVVFVLGYAALALSDHFTHNRDDS